MAESPPALGARGGHPVWNLPRLATALRGLIVILVIVASGQITYHVLIAPRLRIRSIVFESDVPLSKIELERIAGLSGRDYYFSLRSQGIEERLESHPAVKSAMVEKIFPDSVRLTVIGRKPLAVAVFDTADNVSVPAVFDEEGVVFQVGFLHGSTDLPIISGFKSQQITPGMSLPAVVLPFLTDLRTIQEESPELFGMISELHVKMRDQAGFDVTFYPTSGPVRVLLGDRIDAETLTYAFMVLDILGSQEQNVRPSEIDFRTGEAVYADRVP